MHKNDKRHEVGGVPGRREIEGREKEETGSKGYLNMKEKTPSATTEGEKSKWLFAKGRGA